MRAEEKQLLNLKLGWRFAVYLACCKETYGRYPLYQKLQAPLHKAGFGMKGCLSRTKASKTILKVFFMNANSSPEENGNSKVPKKNRSASSWGTSVIQFQSILESNEGVGKKVQISENELFRVTYCSHRESCPYWDLYFACRHLFAFGTSAQAATSRVLSLLASQKKVKVGPTLRGFFGYQDEQG